MAIVNNPYVAGASGAVGDQIVYRQRNGKTILCKYPNMKKRKLTEKQLKVNEVMRYANYHVRGILADEQTRNEAQIRLNIPRNRLYTALIREYFQTHYKPEPK